MGNGVCSRRQRRIFQSLMFITVVFGMIYGGMLSYEMHKQLKRTEATALKYQQHQESLSAQLQVVYEHRSRLEKSLQKERQEHKKAKEDYLVYKLEAQQSINKEKQDGSSRYSSLHVQHQMLKNQHEDLKKQFYDLQEQHHQQGENHGRALDEEKERYEKLQQEKEAEMARIKVENVFNLREENKQLRKAHQDIHMQLQNSQIQHKDLKEAHSKLASTLEDHKSALAAAQIQVNEFKQLKETLDKRPSSRQDAHSPAREHSQPLAEQHGQAPPPAQPRDIVPEEELRVDLQDEEEAVRSKLQSHPPTSQHSQPGKAEEGEREGEAERKRELAEEEMEQAGQPQKLEEEADQPQDEEEEGAEPEQEDENALDRRRRQQALPGLVVEPHLAPVERGKSAYEQQREQQRLELQRAQEQRQLQQHQEALQAQRLRDQRDRQHRLKEQKEKEEQHHRELDQREQVLREDQLRKRSQYENMDNDIQGEEDPRMEDEQETERDTLALHQEADEEQDKHGEEDQRVPPQQEGVLEDEVDPNEDPNNQGEDEFEEAEEQTPHEVREGEEEVVEEEEEVKHLDAHPKQPAVDEDLVMAVNPDNQEDTLDDQYQEEGEDEGQEDVAAALKREDKEPYKQTEQVQVKDGNVPGQEGDNRGAAENNEEENYEEEEEEEEEMIVRGKGTNRRAEM